MGFFAESRIRLVEFNVENLFLYLDHYKGQDLATVTDKEWKSFSSSTIANKPLKQVRELTRVVTDLDPDILMLCEVGGVESLSNFSKLFLGDRYSPYLIEGNSDRGIDIGYLVKRSLPFTYDLVSHKHRSIDFLYPHERQTQLTGFEHLRSAKIVSHKFSRDVLELRVFEGESSPEPVLILLLVHLKSQLDRDRIDPGGRDRRKAELEKLIKIRQEIVDEFEGRVPVVLSGDFNGSAMRPSPEPEFEAIYRESDLEDALEWAKQPNDERFTYMQLSNSRTRPGINKQLDYVFLPAALGRRVNVDETWVYRFKDEYGMTMMLPRNFNEKKFLASDHYPVVVTLDPAKR
jgi:hypothetical protein